MILSPLQPVCALFGRSSCRWCFVVSTGRSGTTTLAHAVNQVPGVWGVHEPAPVLVREASGYRYGQADRVRLREILRETRQPRRRGEVYCEVNQAISLLVPVVQEAFPNARFVWLLRNGVDVVASAVQKQWYTGHSENHDRYEDCPDNEKMWIDGRIRGDHCREVEAAQWDAMLPFEKCCWYWQYVNRIIESDLRVLAPGRRRTIRLERLADDLPALLRWMGARVPGDLSLPTLNAAKRPVYGWSGWTDAERDVFERWCGEAMDGWYPGWRERSCRP